MKLKYEHELHAITRNRILEVIYINYISYVHIPVYNKETIDVHVQCFQVKLGFYSIQQIFNNIYGFVRYQKLMYIVLFSKFYISHFVELILKILIGMKNNLKVALKYVFLCLTNKEIKKNIRETNSSL